jgi:hypothetical protein
MRLDGVRVGRCLVREADFDALTLLDEAVELGVSLVVVVTPCSGGGGVVVEAFEPLRPRLGGRETVALVRELWMNLTGSLGAEEWAAALRVLSPRPFLVVRLGDVGRLGELLGALCWG